MRNVVVVLLWIMGVVSVLTLLSQLFSLSRLDPSPATEITRSVYVCGAWLVLTACLVAALVNRTDDSGKR